MANLQHQSYDDNRHSPMLTEVLQSLPKLSAEELEQVSKRLALLRGATPSLDGGTDWLLAGIIHEVRRHGLIGPDERISSKTVRRIAPEFEEQSAHVRAGLLKGCRGSKPTPEHQNRLGKIAAECLYASLNFDGRRAPLGLKAMLSNVSETLAAVDRSFPGYLKGGTMWILASSGADDN